MSELGVHRDANHLSVYVSKLLHSITKRDDLSGANERATKQAPSKLCNQNTINNIEQAQRARSFSSPRWYLFFRGGSKVSSAWGFLLLVRVTRAVIVRTLESTCAARIFKRKEIYDC